MPTEKNLTVSPSEGSRAIAGFPKIRARLAAVAREMRIDDEALARPLRRCDLSACGGTCCYDGVYLSAEEAEVVRRLANEFGEEFEAMGLELPEKVVVYGKWPGIASGPKTAVRPAPERESLPDYPVHFAKTSCVFLLPDARCGLQLLASEQGLHPWHWKPVTCWLHPLAIVEGADGKSVLTLPDESNDPQRLGDYDGFACRTGCGKTECEGEPAVSVLAEELEVLRELAAE